MARGVISDSVWVDCLKLFSVTRYLLQRAVGLGCVMDYKQHFTTKRIVAHGE